MESKCAFSNLPAEMVREILQYLYDSDAFNASLVCEWWMKWTNPLSAGLEELKLTFNSGCDNTAILDNIRIFAELCTCENHLLEQCALIQAILGLRGIDQIRRVHIEDDIPKPNSGVPNAEMNSIVHRLNRDVECLQFTNLDLSFVNILTFARLAQFRNINTLIFVDCTFPSDMNQSRFIKNITPVLPTVENLEITGTPFVNDEFGFALAKFGMSLHNVNLERCQNISAITIASFCTRAGTKKRIRPIVFNLHSTRFDFTDLDRILHNPIIREDNAWAVQLSDLRHINGRITVNLSNPQDNGYTVFY